VFLNPKPVMSDYLTFDAAESLDRESRYLINKAKEATSHSYSPYSKFKVGAALILDDGTVVPGSNQENASYPLCMCAERVVLYAASAIYPGHKIHGLAVVAQRAKERNLVPATPCGACRQVLFEFEERQKKPIRIVLFGPGKKWFQFPSAASLLPLAFDKNSL